MAATPNATQVKKRVSWIVIRLAKLIREQGGIAYLVGGSVRDILIGKKVADYDIEVHGLPAAKIEKAVKKLNSKIFEVGKVFGVLKIVKGKTQIDVTLPRSDSKISAGHRGFSVNADPFMGTKEAARRRDFTVNAILLDPLTGEFIDPFGGIKDIKNGTLKVVDAKKFSEDPLRALRAVQIAARFNLKPDAKTLTVLQKTAKHLKELSHERIWAEWKKLFLSDKPSLGLELALQAGLFGKSQKIFERLKTTKQDKIWHPEGNVWTHTKITADRAVEIARREKLNPVDTIILVIAALCHDLGKPETTFTKGGRVHSYGHEHAGLDETKNFLKEIGADKSLHNKILTLCKNHMRPTGLYGSYKRDGTISNSAIYRLADEMAKGGSNIYFLTLLKQADEYGRKDRADEGSRWLLRRASRLKVQYKKPKDIVRGRDLLKLGLKPGPQIGKLIDEANRLHKEKGYTKDKILKVIKNKYA